MIAAKHILRTGWRRKDWPACCNCRWLRIRRQGAQTVVWCVIRHERIPLERLRRRACEGFEPADATAPGC